MWWAAWVATAVAGAPSLDAVVLIEQVSSVCSGAVVDPQGHVLTAYHCIARGGPVRVTRYDGTGGRARVESVDPARDLALLSVEALADGPFIEVATTPPSAGDEVWTVGHPFGAQPPGGYLEGTLRFAMSWGHVSVVGPYTLQFTAPVNPGNSGGPVFDAEGRQVGVVSRRLTGDGLGFASHASDGLVLREQTRKPSLFGGTLELEPHVSTWGGDGGGVGIGGHLGVVLRDRVHLVVGGAFPLSARWDAVRWGRASWVMADARVGVRQRLFGGPLSTYLELQGGVANIAVLTGERETLDTDQDLFWTPLVGGRVGLANIALEGGAGLDADGTWVTWGQLVLSWPGTLTYF